MPKHETAICIALALLIVVTFYGAGFALLAFSS